MPTVVTVTDLPTHTHSVQFYFFHTRWYDLIESTRSGLTTPYYMPPLGVRAVVHHTRIFSYKEPLAH
jgi:hypothetical protein